MRQIVKLVPLANRSPETAEAAAKALARLVRSEYQAQLGNCKGYCFILGPEERVEFSRFCPKLVETCWHIVTQVSTTSKLAFFRNGNGAFAIEFLER